MQSRQAPPLLPTSHCLILVAAAGVWSTTAVGASSYSTCDPVTAKLELTLDELSLKNVDHGTPSSVATEPAQRLAAAVAERFDELLGPASAATPAVSKTVPVEAGKSAPLADAGQPPAADVAEPFEPGDVQLPLEPVPGVAPQLPGVTDAELRLFRRQMYRTDI